MLALTENPPIMPETVGCLTELSGPWWVAHTKSRFEKAFAWDLLSRGIGFFLPMCQRITFSGGRKRKGMTPLFPSYVFFCGGENIRWQALATNRLCRVLAAPKQEQLVAELEQVRRVLQSGQPMELYPTLPVGTRCRVTAGPFKGMVGVIADQSKPSRLVLTVDVLAKGASLTIDADLLEPEESFPAPAARDVYGRGSLQPQLAVGALRGW
jgi:transcription antitermination factor NusG